MVMPSGPFRASNAAARSRRSASRSSAGTALERLPNALDSVGPGEDKLLRLVCPFDPQRLVVDPDAKVLQLQRKAASVRL